MPVRSSPKIQAQARKCHQTLRESAKIRAQEAQITARCEWANRGYPVIQWEQLEDRLDSCNETIHCALENDIRCEDHLEHDSQSYWQRITQQISQASAGYYGPRGVDIISDHVAYKYASKIRAVAASHCLISTIGVPAFILTKLVPIAAVWMIAEDMHVDKRQAWCIFKDSKELGEILNNNE
ncbi:MAG: hypothetical protein M1835_001812 [Candelina submexicana]|nr:MAG: hypothetical protein M1835_001812 [Candelina submexicana]